MKVECTRIINELAKTEPPPEIQKRRLTVGRRYVVLEVSFSHQVSMCWYRIECDDGKPWLILSTQFEIVSDRVPPNWVVRQYDDGGITFSPASWLQNGYWDRLFAADPAARQTYEEEKLIIEF